MPKQAEPKTQKEKFLAAAQNLGGSEKAFNDTLKRIGKAKVAPRKPKQSKKSR